MDQPTITPGQNGYAAMLPVPTFGPNPWAVAGQADQALATQGMSQGTQTISGLQGQMSALQTQPQDGYPTYPNAHGIGTQSAFQAAPQAAQAPAPQMSSAPMMGSTGANPWSLRGEALSR